MAIKAAMEFENNHTLPLLAMHATWCGVQSRGEKLLSLDKLLGRKGDTAKKNEPMTNTDMVSNVLFLHKKALENKKKKEENDKGK